MIVQLFLFIGMYFLLVKKALSAPYFVGSNGGFRSTAQRRKVYFPSDTIIATVLRQQIWVSLKCELNATCSDGGEGDSSNELHNPIGAFT